MPTRAAGRMRSASYQKNVRQTRTEDSEEYQRDPAGRRQAGRVSESAGEQPRQRGGQPAADHHVEHHRGRGVPLERLARVDGEERPGEGAERDEEVADRAEGPRGERPPVAARDDEQYADRADGDAGALAPAQALLQDGPADESHGERCRRDDPRGRGRERGDEARHLQTLVNRDAEHADAEEREEIARGRKVEAAAPGDGGEEDEDADAEAEADDREGTGLAHGDLGGDEGRAPHDDREQGAEVRPRRRHRLTNL